MSITLLELRTEARQRADQEDSDFITDAELTNYINKSIAELHDILIQSYGSDYFLAETTITTVIDQPTLPLPSDFYKVRGVDANLNGDEFITLRKFNFNERNRFEGFGVWSFLGVASIRYRVMGANIRFTPTPDRATKIRIFYIPLSTKLVSDTDTLDDFNQWSEYVIVDAAIKMMVKEETDPSILLAEKSALKRRIEEVSQDRDASEPESVSDIHAEDNDIFFGRGDT